MAKHRPLGLEPLFSSVPFSKFVSVSDLWRAFWSWQGAFEGTALRCFLEYRETRIPLGVLRLAWHVKNNWRKPMGCALNSAVYDFTPIYSRLWQSVSMAVGYPVCGTANPRLLHSPYFTSLSFPSSGHTKISKPSGLFPHFLLSLLCPQTVTK